MAAWHDFILGFLYMVLRESLDSIVLNFVHKLISNGCLQAIDIIAKSDSLGYTMCFASKEWRMLDPVILQFIFLAPSLCCEMQVSAISGLHEES